MGPILLQGNPDQGWGGRGQHRSGDGQAWSGTDTGEPDYPAELGTGT